LATPRKRAVIYCRVSTDKQEQDGESLEYQEEKCRRYAELHEIDVVIVLHEAKSGFIHYSMREKLTFARSLIRDHMADMIIVFDLRRFSRNFVHSAMIFEEVESIELIRETIRANIERDVQNFLEHTQGRQQLAQLTQEIAFAEAEWAKHPEGSYYYRLITQDIQDKQAIARKYEEEYKHAEVPSQLLNRP